MSFKENHYQIIRNVLNEEMVEYIRIICEVHEKSMNYLRPKSIQEPFPFSDHQGPKSFSWYGSIQSEGLLVFLKPIFSQISQKKLVESYSYWRSYYKGSILERHSDRKSCEYSATICIDKDEDWPILFETLDKNNVSVELEPGDLIFYRGPMLEHWRDEYKGKKHVQLFLHYVDSEGEFAYTNTFDGRPELGLSAKSKMKDCIND